MTTLVALTIATPGRSQVTFAGTQLNIAGTSLASPSGVAADGAGNVYIADQGNNRIISVTLPVGGDGVVTTILGGLSAPAGVASDWSGNVYVADTGNDRILMLPRVHGVLAGPLVVASGLNEPTGVAVDSGANIYVADTGNNRIIELPRMSNGYGSQVPVIAGLGSPRGVAVDGANNLYVADTGNNRVLKYPYSSSGYLTQQVVGRGLVAPMGVAVDTTYNVYIADTGNSRVVEEPWFAGARRYNSQVIVGSDADSPVGVARDWSGAVYVADSGDSRVSEIVSSSINFGALNVGSSGATQTYNFNISAGTVIGSVSIYMQGVAGRDFSDAGGSTCTAQTYAVAAACGVNVAFVPFASGTRAGAVVIYDPQGNVLASAFIAGCGLMPKAAYTPGTRTVLGTQLSGPSGVTVDGSGNVYIADTGNNRVVELLKTSEGYGTQAVVPLAGLSSPMGLAIDGAGNLYVVSNGNDKVLRLAWTGSGFGLQTKVGAAFYGPTGAAADTGGNIYVADTLEQYVVRLPWAGNSFAQVQHLGGYVKCPYGVAADARGNVFFSMPYQNQLAEVALVGGKYQEQAQIPLSRTSFPSALAIDGNSNIYVLDTGNNKVVMLPWNGSGYGNQVTVATGFNAPGAMALDSDGNLYVADTGNNQVVKIDFSNPAPMSFADTYLGSTSKDSSQIITVENVGNQPLGFSSIHFPPDFPADTNAVSPCPEGGFVGQGSNCQFAIDFRPAAIGDGLAESLAFTIDASTAQQVVSLTGSSLGKIAQTIVFPPIADTIYGAAPIALAATASSGLPVSYHIVSGPAVLVQGGHSISANGTGLVTLQATQVGTSTYAEASSVNCSFQVLPAVLTVTPVNVTTVFGSAPSSFGYTVRGFVAGDSASQVLTGSAAVISSGGTSPSAGSYVLSAAAGTLAAANYTFLFKTGTLMVNKATLVVKVASATMVYGGALPEWAWTLSGFVNGDTQSVVVGTPAISTTATARAPVGSYTLSPSLGTLSAANYGFVFSSGVLSVAPATLTVTADSQTFVYGSSGPRLTYSISGFATGESQANAIAGVPVLTSLATMGSGVGTYPIVAGIGSLKARNYIFRFVAGVASVGKAVLLVTPVDASMTYGGELPHLGFGITGFVGADTMATSIAGSPTIVTAVTRHSKPGSFAITATSGFLTAKNYRFLFGVGQLTVNKAILTVRVQPASMSYGGNLPKFKYELSGFVNGDNASAVVGVPAWHTAATGHAPVGTYPVTGEIGSLTSKNYNFQLENGVLTVTKAPLEIVPDRASMVYGASIPAFTYKLRGFVNGDSSAVATGNPTFVTAASAHPHVGSYVVTAGVGSLGATNYSFVAGTSKLSVQKAVLTVTAQDASSTYGSPIAVMAATFTGWVNDDSLESATTGTAKIWTVSSGASVGSYTIKCALGTLSAPDYSFVFRAGTLKVNPASLTVTADSLSMKLGDALPTLTYTVTGMVNGDRASAAVKGKAVLTTLATQSSAAGSYPITITQGTMRSANYTLSFVDGTLTVD